MKYFSYLAPYSFHVFEINANDHVMYSGNVGEFHQYRMITSRHPQIIIPLSETHVVFVSLFPLGCLKQTLKIILIMPYS